MAEKSDVETGPTETTPLVAGGEEEKKEDEREDGVNDDDLEEHYNREGIKEKVVTGAAIAAVGTSVGSIIMAPNPLVYVSSALGVGMAPYAAFQQRKITEVAALKKINEDMETQVNKLKEENERLSGNVDQLEGSVANLQELEETLTEIKKTEGQTLDVLEEQLEESKGILDQMEDNLKSTVVQNLISVVLACDDDGDMTLDDEEIDQLIGRMERMNGVDIDDDRFRNKIIGAGRSLNAVMEVVRTLLDDDIPEEDRIFHFQ